MPQSRFDAFDCTGVLNQWLNPTQVGAQGLTACNNLQYHRQGTWAKRPGATRVALPANQSDVLVSGFRWYRTFPSVVTKLFVWQQKQLLVGNSPDTLAPVPAGPSGAASLTSNISPDFCSARDPQAGPNGADICIMTGITLATGSFSSATITIRGLPAANLATTAALQLTVSDGSNPVTTASYQVLPTDNPSSIANQLVIMLNETAAYLYGANSATFPAYLGTSWYNTPNPDQTTVPANPPNPQAIVHLGARTGGSAGNNLTISLTATDVTSATSPAYPMSFTLTNPSGATAQTTGGAGAHTIGPLNFSGGGNPWSGPVRYDNHDGFLTGLSYMAANAFTGCSSWHDHVWFWGDPNNPDTVFASDLLQPESFTFMAQNGGMDADGTKPINGGYNIGPGDGDPAVQCCVPNGNSLYIFKTGTIYQVTGYDFQAGEYQFSVTPQVVGYGIPSRDCVDVLEGQFVFWSGKKFLRLAVGAYEPEHIGLPVALTEGLASLGDQTLVKVAAGDFVVQTTLTDIYSPLGFGFGGGGGPGAPPQQPILLRSVALFAVDTGSGAPNTILIYDDEKTAFSGGNYAWSIWNGWNIGCWIKYGAGVNPSGKQDRPRLYFVEPSGQFMYHAGNDPVSDWGNPIPWTAQTGWIDFTTPELIKNIHEFYLRVETTVGSTFTVTVIPARIVPPIGQTSQFPVAPVSFAFAPALAANQREALNDLKAFIQAALRTQACMVQFFEDGTSFSEFELQSYGIDCNPQEAYQT